MLMKVNGHMHSDTFNSLLLISFITKSLNYKAKNLIHVCRYAFLSVMSSCSHDLFMMSCSYIATMIVDLQQFTLCSTWFLNGENPLQQLQSQNTQQLNKLPNCNYIASYSQLYNYFIFLGSQCTYSVASYVSFPFNNYVTFSPTNEQVASQLTGFGNLFLETN